MDEFTANANWKEDEQVCEWEHCVHEMPYKEGEGNCWVFGHDCPGGLEKIKECNVTIEDVKEIHGEPYDCFMEERIQILERMVLKLIDEINMTDEALSDLWDNFEEFVELIISDDEEEEEGDKNEDE